MKTSKKMLMLILAAAMVLVLSSCGEKKEKIVIYTSLEDFRLEVLNKRLAEEFPQYDVTVEYLSTGNHAAKLLAEGTETDADITYNLEYSYLQKLENEGYLADLSAFSMPKYMEDTKAGSCYAAQERNGGSIVLSPELLEEKGLPEPTSYQDLLDPMYRGLISMPSPKASGTGYMFLKSLVNAWGTEEAFAYFDALTPNILQYTSSGAGPLNAVLQGEAAIGLGMTAPAVTEINKGAKLKLVYFEEGAPYSMYGLGIIKGKEDRQAVQEVFDFLLNTFNYENCEKFFPEKIYEDRDFSIENYPQDIRYADMSNDSVEEKERLLEMWKY